MKRADFRPLAAFALAALLAPLGTTRATAPALDAALAGVWQNSGEDLEMVFLPDGRVFCLNTRGGNRVEGEPGTWQTAGGRLVVDWRISGAEREAYEVDGDELTLAGWQRLTRVGNAREAANTYAERVGRYADIARRWAARYPVGPARPAKVEGDPHPERAPNRATVYTGAGLEFEDLTILTGTYKDAYQQVHEYKTGQAVAFLLLPNGRFRFQSWLPRGLDADFRPVHELTTVWGSYALDPGEGDPMKGDTVTLRYDGGDVRTATVLGGRRFLRTANVLYFNQHPRPDAQQERQFR